MLELRYVTAAKAVHRGRCFLLFAAAAMLMSCGGGGGGDGGSGTPPPDPSGSQSTGFGSITIDTPVSDSSYSTDADSIEIGGTAFISPRNSVCCSGSATDTGVTVTWSAGAGGGVASQSVQYCSGPFGGARLCDHRWSAQVALALGTNTITVRAADSSNNSARRTITITRTPDRTAPNLIGIGPGDRANGVAVNTSVSALFSEAMDVASFSPTTFTLRDPAGAIIGSTRSSSLADRLFTLFPAAPLAAFTTYTATVTGVRDVSGNVLEESFSWSFTTGAAPDTTPPALIDRFPKDGDACVPIDAKVVATFNEPVDSATVDSNNFLLKDAGRNMPVPANVSQRSDRSFWLTPLSGLSYSSTYLATIGPGVQDLAGNATASSSSWTFTTVAGGQGTWSATDIRGEGPKIGHTALWTGTEMIVFGRDPFPFDTSSGSRYRPASDTWIPLNSLGNGGPRFGHVAVWTGNRMIIWGGQADFSTSSIRRDGRIYDPVTDSWQQTALAPAARTHATGVWTGTEMLVWGGSIGTGFTGDMIGGRYNLATDSWQSISTIGAPLDVPSGHTAVWTGTRMIVWGGGIGGMYDPVTDTWESVASSGAPSARTLHTAVWTGTEMAIWGGIDATGHSLNTGGLYNPRTNTWRPISTACAATPRGGHSVVWTGSEMIVWGGSITIGGGEVASGARYDPSSDAWQDVPVVGAPGGRVNHTAVWTGTSMIIWGGDTGAVPTNSGGVYQP